MNMHIPPADNKSPSPTDPDEALFSASDAPATAPQEPEAKSDLHKAARDYAAKGWPVFPCISNAQGLPLPPKQRKKPACAHGFKDATTDLAQIDAWWTENPAYNIGFEPERARLAVIDRDVRDDGEGDVGPLNLPATLQARSAGGGDHLFFVGSLPSNAHNLGPKIDTRGTGGYVLLAPSRVNNSSYTWANDLPPAPLPANVKAMVAVKMEPAKAPEGVEIDSAINIERGRHRLRDLVAQGRVAVQGSGGNTFTYQIGCELIRDLGLSVDRALELMLSEWNPHCQPPWDQDELRTVISNPASYGQNESGAYAVSPASEMFAKLPTPREHEPTEAQDALHPRFLMTAGEMLTLPTPKPLIEDFLMQHENAAVFGPEKLGKSFAMLDIALSVAAGLPVFGGLKVCAPGPVIYLTGEGQFGFKSRIMAWGKAHGIDVAKLPFYFKAEVPRAMDGIEQVYIDGIRAQLGRDPVLIIFDTMANSIVGEDENGSKALSRYWSMVSAIGSHLGAATLTVAHTGKDEGKGIRGWSGTGGTIDRSILADGDRDSKTLRLHHKYAKDTADFPDTYLRLKSVMLANGSSAVIEPITKEQYENKARPEADAAKATRTILADTLRELKMFSLMKGRTIDEMADILAGEPPRDDGDREPQIRWQTRRSTWREKLRNGTRERSGGKNRPKTPPTLRGLFSMADYFNNGQVQPIFWMPEVETPGDDLKEES